jgi:excisionase family DNA binding protein
MTGMEKKRMITLSEAAGRIGVTADALRQAIRRGTLSAQKVGPLYLVATTEVDAYKQRTGGTKGRPRKQPPPREETDK